MVRTFKTHEIRKQTELCGYWGFSTEEGLSGSCLAGENGEITRAPVPGCWENIPGLETFSGTAVYTREIEAGGHVRFVFGGVSHTAEISFDGAQIARHYNAFTSFDALSPNTAAGTHTVSVRVTNAFGPDSALHVPNDYYTYGGITRPVVMEILPDVYITHVHAAPVLTAEGWSLELTAGVRNIGQEAHSVLLSCKLAGNIFSFAQQTLASGETVLLTGKMDCSGVSPYEPSDPVLYKLVSTLSIDGEPRDDLIERVGFRVVEVKGKDILWNSKPLRLKGFCRHEDHPDYGCALPYQAMCRDIALMRDLGANAVRTSHYPNDPLFLDLCDEAGLLVWEENHARGLSEEQMKNPNFRRQCEDCNCEMVFDHFNHPSIFIWGILNECASDTEYGASCYREQLDQLRALDSTRPVTFASCRFRNDISLGFVDVVSYNIYPQWYLDDTAEEYLRGQYDWCRENGGAGKPFIISEVGAGGIYGCRDARRAKWSEERQSDILEKQLTAVLADENVCGVFVWQFCDVRVDESWFDKRPRTMNNKGIVDEYRRPKLSYGTVRRIFREM